MYTRDTFAIYKTLFIHNFMYLGTEKKKQFHSFERLNSADAFD